MKNIKIILFVLGVLILGGILIGVTQPHSEKVKIGIIIPLSGPAASLTDDLKKTLEMYEKESKNIEFVYQDDQCTGKGALSAYNILKGQGVKIYIAACSGSILALAPVVKEDNNVILTAFGGSTEIRKTGDEVIRFIPDGLSIANQLIDLIKENPQKKYVVLYEKQDYAQSVKDLLEKETQNKIVSYVEYKGDSMSYKSELTKIKSLDFDEIIFIPVNDQATRIILKEMNELKIGKNIFGEVNVCDKLDIFKENNIHGSCLKTVLDSEGYKKYISKFSNEYGHEPTYPFYNAITYDILYFIDSNINNLKKVDAAAVNTLKQRALQGIDGRITRYDFESNGDVISKKQYLKVLSF